MEGLVKVKIFRRGLATVPGLKGTHQLGIAVRLHGQFNGHFESIILFMHLNG
jgi:hypothetical protein